MPKHASASIYTSGHWEIDLGTRELRAAGGLIPIGGRAFEIIEILVRSAGDLITKDELMDRVWPGITVGETTLQVHISAIRKCLGKDRDLLQTVSGRGYRLLGQWAARPDEPAPHRKIGPTPKPRLVQSFQNNLPSAGSELIGRTAAVQQIRDLVSAYRVVTLTGPGGIGKSRLALEIAQSLQPEFGGAVWLVELAALSDPGLVPSAVASALGLRLADFGITFQSIAAAIGERRILLVLDNCEHLVDAAAGMAETIVRSCQNASVLATSQELLRIDGEHVYPVQPLDVPPVHAPGTADTTQHSAIQLFLARMRVLHEHAATHHENLAALAAICRRLDGMPLAIELAAAQAATLGPETVLSRLDDRFRLLVSGRRTALPRHRTLRATLEWSYQLLPDDERRVLRCLAIFAGSFTLDAATAVATDDADRSATETRIASLVQKSLISRDPSEPTTRWRLLESTRAFAIEKLAESGNSDEFSLRHARFYQDLSAPADNDLRAASSTENLSALGREIDNVRVALDWAFGAGESAIGVALTAWYVPVWLDLSLQTECRDRVERATAALGANTTLSAPQKMRFHITLLIALLFTAEPTTGAENVFGQALALAEELHDASSQMRTLWAAWTFYVNIGDIEAAIGVASRLIQVAKREGDVADELVGDRLLGLSYHYRGDQAEARIRLGRVVDLYVAPSDQRHAAWFFHDQLVLARANYARTLWLQGSTEKAKFYAQSCLEGASGTYHRSSRCLALATSACPIFAAIGDLATATASVAILADIVEIFNVDFYKSVLPCLQGELLIKRGEFAQGVELIRRSIDIFGNTRWLPRQPNFRIALAEGLASLGQVADAIAIIDETLICSDNWGEHWCDAELFRVKGELLLLTTDGAFSFVAERMFLKAIEIARKQGALFWELRTTTSLARSWIGTGRLSESRQMLAEVYDRFTEGFETVDLRSARVILDALPL